VYTSKLSAEAQQALKRKHRLYKEVQNQVINQPDEAAELIRTWLIEDAIEVERERAEKQRARA
jgi:flagellar M-ring protein FliF